MANRPGQQVWRARFSAVSEASFKAAMASLGVPNEAEASAVDARQAVLYAFKQMRLLLRWLLGGLVAEWIHSASSRREPKLGIVRMPNDTDGLLTLARSLVASTVTSAAT